MANTNPTDLEETDLEESSSAPTKKLAWEMIEEGRYQPKRITGSCLGRELG